MKQLKPCPFCGSEAELIPMKFSALVECRNEACGCEGPLQLADSSEMAVELATAKWNTRAAPAEDVREVAKLTIGQFYTSTCGFGRMEYIGTTYDIDGYLPTFRSQNGKTKAYSHDQLASRFEEFAYSMPLPSRKVLMPERHEDRCDSSEAEAYQNGWNACLDEFARLNK